MKLTDKVLHWLARFNIGRNDSVKAMPRDACPELKLVLQMEFNDVEEMVNAVKEFRPKPPELKSE